MVIMSKFMTVRERGPIFTEYLESNGAQWIDTKLIGQNGIAVEGAFMANSLDNAQIIGCYKPSRYYPLAIQSGKIALGYSTSWYSSSITVQTGKKYEFAVAISANTQKVSIDGVEVISATNTGNITTTPAMYLFAFNDSDLYADGFFKGRLYPIKFRLNGELVRDYRPCYDKEGVPAMYDMVSKTYSYLDGSGGPVVEMTFTVNGTSFTAEQGVTWRTFVNSSYNPGDFTVDTSGVRYGSSLVRDSSGNAVSADAVIISGHVYKTA